ncbi:hypothetical protein JXB28_04405 [Candidatus Woesearchaeota archaeon]|nr:hypothetical protein [Candidatus Woesearchaeota archaeon]
MDKKASMELGVNAIIILIIALAILGLALSFVTGLFKGGQEKLGGLVDRVDMPVHADSTNPLVFGSNEVIVKMTGNDKSATLLISVYNSNFQDGEPVGLHMTSCVFDQDPDGNYYFNLAAPKQSIPPGGDSGYRAIITPLDNIPTDPTTFICTITAWGDYYGEGGPTVSQQIIIKTIK